jgi:hypothetical protein
MEIELPSDWPDEATKLGEPIAEFRPGSFQYVLLVVGGVVGALLGLAFLGVMVYVLLDGGPWGPRAKSIKGIIVGFVLLSGGIATLLRAVRSGKLRVYAFTGGLARVQGSQTEVLRWEDINEVRRNPNVKTKGLTVSRPSQLILKLRDGQQLIFEESLSRLKDLRALVEQHTRDFMLNALREALQAGAAVAFGPLTVSAEGISHESQTLPWTECTGVKVDGGSLIVSRTDARRPFCKVRVEEVPNTHVLIALTDNQTGARGEQQG